MGKRLRRQPARVGLPPHPTLGIARFDVGRGELLLVVFAVACGTLLRIAFPANMAVEHFDEGVYASNLWFTKEFGYAFHLRHLYAPPLMPSLIEASLVVEQLLLRPGGQPSSLAVMAPGLLAGCATPVLIWWVTRGWFGAAPAAAAMLLASLSDFHALYSRTALTDVLLVFWLLLAVWLAERACAVYRPAWIFAAGLITALAWWTKYNGWLPLAILLSGVAAAVVFDSAARRQGRRLFGCWLATAAVTLVCWCPCLLLLQSEGGYAAVAANHRQYLTGLAGWPSGLLQQAANLRHFDGWITALGLLLAIIAAGWHIRRDEHPSASGNRIDWVELLTRVSLAVLLAGLAVWIGSAVVLLLLGLYGLTSWLVSRCNEMDDQTGSNQGPISKPGGSLLRLPRRALNTELQERFQVTGTAAQTLPVWMTLAWVVGLWSVTPLYHPYPRLTLPWLCAIWIAAGLGIARLLRPLAKSVRNRGSAGRAVTCLAFAALTLAAAGPRLARRGVPAWQPRTGLLLIARKIRKTVERDLAQHVSSGNTVLFVYGEPGLFYHLRAEAQTAAAPIGDLKVATTFAAPDTTAYLVTGPHAHHSESFAKQFAETREHFEPVQTFQYLASDLVLLNRYHPRKLAGSKESIGSEVRVYRVR